MPITPLHLGLLAPINHWFPGKVSNLSFWLITLWLDANAIVYYGMGLELGEIHGPGTHSLLGALIGAGIIALFNMVSLAWILGAVLGAVTHILLDMLVHAEMQPLFPYTTNPFYWGDMGLISVILIAPFVWLIAQYVKGCLGWARKILEAEPPEPPEPGV